MGCNYLALLWHLLLINEHDESYCNYCIDPNEKMWKLYSCVYILMLLCIYIYIYIYIYVCIIIIHVLCIYVSVMPTVLYLQIAFFIRHKKSVLCRQYQKLYFSGAQHYFRWWLGAIRQQAITWVNVIMLTRIYVEYGLNRPQWVNGWYFTLYNRRIFSRAEKFCEFYL